MKMMRELIARMRSAIGFVRAGSSAGTGFLVQGTNHVITCYHVVQRAKLEEVSVAFEHKQLRPESVQPYAQYDLVILLLPQDELPKGGLEIGKFTEVEPGDDLLILGFPAGEQVLTAIRGFTSAKVRFTLEAVKLDAAVVKGMSGSPCIHVSSGKVIGVVSAQVPVRSVLQNALKSINDLRERAVSLQNETQNIARLINERSGHVFISRVDPLATTAKVLMGIAKIAEELQKISKAMEEYAESIPLGLGYAISIEYYYQALQGQ